MKGRTAKLFFLILLSLTLVPAAYCINFTPGIYFEGNGGGLVDFDQNFAAYTVTLGPNRFTRFNWNGNNYGTLGFDADPGVNVTVTNVNDNSVTYDVAGAGAVNTYIYYDGDPPMRSDGATNTNHNDASGVTTVLSPGGGTVTLYYGEVSSEIRASGKVMANLFTLFAIMCIFGAFGEAKNGQGKMTEYLIALAAVMAIAAMIAGWGY